MNNNLFCTRSKVPILGAPQIKLSCQKLSKIVKNSVWRSHICDSIAKWHLGKIFLLQQASGLSLIRNDKSLSKKKPC